MARQRHVPNRIANRRELTTAEREAPVMEAIRRGSVKDYLSRFHDGFGSALYRKIGHWLQGQRADQDDIYEETFVSLAAYLSNRDIKAMAADGRALRLPFTIARRRVADHLRRLTRASSQVSNLPEDLDDGRDLASEIKSADGVEYVLFVFDAVLNEREKTVFLALHEYIRDNGTEPTLEEHAKAVSQRTGKPITPAALRSIFRRAIPRLKPYITDQDVTCLGPTGDTSDASRAEPDRPKGGGNRP